MAAAHWIKSAVLATAAAAALLGPAPQALAQPAGAAGTATPEAGADAVQRDLNLQERILLDPNSSVLQREEAARKLVSRDADPLLLRLLFSEGASRDVQLAVAKALAVDPTPNPDFVQPLIRLMGEDVQLTDAAAQALATFKDNPNARGGMARFVANLTNILSSRRAVVRAMGKLVDKPTAETLVRLLNAPNENDLMRETAAAALEQMTGESFGTDPQRWAQWWGRAQMWQPDEWALAIARVNAAQADNADARLQLLRDSTYKREAARYRDLYAKEPSQAIAELLKLMTDPSEDLRTVGVQILYDDAGRVPPPQVAEQLRRMVGDSSPVVRERVALTLGAINDQAAVDALLTQAAQERDPDVLAAIIGALGPASQLRGDFTTVQPLLMRSLNHESFTVSRSAAEALKSLAGLLRDPKHLDAATKVARELQDRLRGTGGNVAAQKLRESIVESLAELAHPSSAAIFQGLLNHANENPIVRIAALRGLRNIADPNTAQSIVNVLSNDPDRGVRLEAAQALLTTAQYANIQQIYPRLNESVETDQQVREAVWKVMSGLFSQASPEQLESWSQEFKKGSSRESLERRLVVLNVLEKKLAALADEHRLAVQRQNLGDVLLDLERPEEASIKYLQALKYWNDRGVPEFVKHQPVVNTMMSLLRAKKDVEACTFAIEAIAQNKPWEQDMWVQVKSEIERRQKRKDAEGALALLREARKVTWTDLRSGQLDAMEKELKDPQGGGTGASRIVHEPRIYEHAAMRTHTG